MGRADDGSWQIAYGYATASSAARCVAVRGFRVRLAVEPQLAPQLCASRDGRRHDGAVQELAHDALLVPASGGGIDPALLESGLKLLQRLTLAIDCVADAVLLLQAGTSRALSSTMMLINS